MSESDQHTGDEDASTSSKDDCPEHEDASRRKFLKVGIGVLSAGVAGAVAVPGTAYFLYPLDNPTTAGSDDFLPAGPREQFPKDTPVKVDLFSDKVDAWNRVEQVKIGSAWVINRGTDLVAFSTICPHLGCAIDYDAAEEMFKCPCHDSAFSKGGEVVGGPSPRALDELDVEADEELVAIRFRRYKQGIPDKEPA